MRYAPLAIIAFAGASVACSNSEQVSAADRKAIADTLQALVVAAHDFSRAGVVERLLSLYPDSGRVISANGGRAVTTKAGLSTEITGFWQRVGQNMQNPKFELGSAYVDVITPNAAVMTFLYRIPHTTPQGRPHTVSGAWTALWRRQQGRWMIAQEHLSDVPDTTTTSAPSDTAAASPSSHNMPGHVMPAPTKPGGGRN